MRGGTNCLRTSIASGGRTQDRPLRLVRDEGHAKADGCLTGGGLRCPRNKTLALSTMRSAVSSPCSRDRAQLPRLDEAAITQAYRNDRPI